MSNILFKDILGVKDLESFEPLNEENVEHWGNIFPNVSDFDFIPAPGETNDDFDDMPLVASPF